MPEYEIQVAGPIGPVVASSLPGFTFLRVPARTILAGTVARPDDLLGVINLLNGHGLALTDVWISHGDHPGEPIPVDTATPTPPGSGVTADRPLGRRAN